MILVGCRKTFLGGQYLYQGTTLVVPSGVQSASIAIEADYFLAAAGWRAAPAVGAKRPKKRMVFDFFRISV